MNINKTALVLEGGGAKCAYQLGALIALNNLGYHFDAISGASFGALNAAIYIKGGTEALFNFYQNVNPYDIYQNQDMVDYIANYNGDKDQLTSSFISYIKSHPHYLANKSNISNSYHKFIMDQVDESKIINSDITLYFTVLEVNPNPLVMGTLLLSFVSDPGLLTSLYQSRNIVGHLIDAHYCNDLPRYIAASANYPTFDPIIVEGKYYLDGGIYNNVPYEIFVKEGYNKIIVIRTNTNEINYPQDKNIIEIKPNSSLGSALYFTHDNIMNLIKQGYEDTFNKLKI